MTDVLLQRSAWNALQEPTKHSPLRQDAHCAPRGDTRILQVQATARSARRVDIEITHFAGARAKCVQLVSMCMDEGHVPVDLARLGVRPPELAEWVWRIAVSRLTMGQCASMST